MAASTPSNRLARFTDLRPYQQSIGMGPAVVPLILDEPHREPHWFWALASITEQNPVPPEGMGKIRMMAEAWVTWGEQQSMLANKC